MATPPEHPSSLLKARPESVVANGDMSEPFPDWGPSPRFVSRAASWVMVALSCGALGLAVGIALGGSLPESVEASPTDALADRPSSISYADDDIEALLAYIESL